MDQLGGVLRRLRFLGAVCIMAMFAGCGLPGFANFAGEVTVFFGAWRPFPLVTALAVWAGLVIGAVYMLRAIRSIFHGPLAAKHMAVAEENWPLRKVPYLFLLIGLLVFGFFPGLLVDKIRPAVQVVTDRLVLPAGGIPGRGEGTQVAAANPGLGAGKP
jgi:NADH-quinone oxidoreductase subunit M